MNRIRWFKDELDIKRVKALVPFSNPNPKSNGLDIGFMDIIKDFYQINERNYESKNGKMFYWRFNWLLNDNEIDDGFFIYFNTFPFIFNIFWDKLEKSLPKNTQFSLQLVGHSSEFPNWSISRFIKTNLKEHDIILDHFKSLLNELSEEYKLLTINGLTFKYYIHEFNDEINENKNNKMKFNKIKIYHNQKRSFSSSFSNTPKGNWSINPKFNIPNNIDYKTWGESKKINSNTLYVKKPNENSFYYIIIKHEINEISYRTGDIKNYKEIFTFRDKYNNSNPSLFLVTKRIL